jgi:hypothetical protein
VRSLEEVLAFPSKKPNAAPLSYATWAIGSVGEISNRKKTIELALKRIKNDTDKKIFYRIGLLDLAFNKASVKGAARYYQTWLLGGGLKKGLIFHKQNWDYMSLDQNILKNSKSYRAALKVINEKILKFISERPPNIVNYATDAVEEALKSGLTLPSETDVKVQLPKFDRVSSPIQYLGLKMTQDVSLENLMLVDAGLTEPNPNSIEKIAGGFSFVRRFMESSAPTEGNSFPPLAAIIGSFRIYGYFTGSVFRSGSDNKWYFEPTEFGTRIVDRYAFSGEEEDPDQMLGYWHPDFGHSFSKAGAMLTNQMFIDFRERFASTYNSLRHEGMPELRCKRYALVQDMQRNAVPSGPPIEIPSLS